MAIEKVEFDIVLEFLIIKLSTHSTKRFERGKNYTLSVSFVGNLTDGLSGLYRSSYAEHGVQKYVNFLFHLRSHCTLIMKVDSFI